MPIHVRVRGQMSAHPHAPGARLHADTAEQTPLGQRMPCLAVLLAPLLSIGRIGLSAPRLKCLQTIRWVERC